MAGQYVEHVVAADIDLDIVRDEISQIDIGNIGRLDVDIAKGRNGGRRTIGFIGVAVAGFAHGDIRFADMPIGRQGQFVGGRGFGHVGPDLRRDETRRLAGGDQGGGEGGRDRILVGDGDIVDISGQRPFDGAIFAEVRLVVGGDIETAGPGVDRVGDCGLDWFCD